MILLVQAFLLFSPSPPTSHTHAHTHLPQRAHALAQQVDAAVVVALQGLGVDLREREERGGELFLFGWPLLL